MSVSRAVDVEGPDEERIQRQQEADDQVGADARSFERGPAAGDHARWFSGRLSDSYSS